MKKTSILFKPIWFSFYIDKNYICFSKKLPSDYQIVLPFSGTFDFNELKYVEINLSGNL